MQVVDVCQEQDGAADSALWDPACDWPRCWGLAVQQHSLGPVFQEGRDPGEALLANAVPIEFVSESAVGHLAKGLAKIKKQEVSLLPSIQCVGYVVGELYELGFAR